MDVFLHLLLPAVVLALVQIPALMRHTRAAMLEVLNEAYILTARARPSRRRILFGML